MRVRSILGSVAHGLGVVSCQGDAARVQHYFEDQGDNFAGDEGCLNLESSEAKRGHVSINLYSRIGVCCPGFGGY